jgi:CrcB protein
VTGWPPTDPSDRDRPVQDVVAGLGRGERLRLLVGRLPVDPDLAPAVLPAPVPAVATACVAAGGLAGALARGGLAAAWPHPAGTWAWSTLVTNVLGSAALAVLLVVLLERFPASRYARPLLGTGLLGGFTTFSTFAVDAADLARVGRPLLAAGYVGLTLAGSLAACLAGLLLARWVLRVMGRARWHRQLDADRARPGEDRS